jgi:sugar/nucleoside kinase (ribokinase family)
MKNSVLCIGYACVDVCYKTSKFPEKNKKMLSEDFEVCGGGPASNAAISVRFLGGFSDFLGYVGKDCFGDFHQREMEDAGVGIDLCYRGDLKTPVVCILATDQNRTAIAYRTKDYWLNEIPQNVDLGKYISVLFDGHQPAISLQILEKCKILGIPTVLDAGSINSGTLSLIKEVDYAVSSEDFSRDLCQKDQTIDILNELVEIRDKKCTVVTLGDKGLVAYKNGKYFQVGAYSVNAIDTTGAGDVFHGCFSYFVEKLPFEDCLLISSAAAALSCTRLGARKSIPRLQEVKDLMIEQKNVRCLEFK